MRTPFAIGILMLAALLAACSGTTYESGSADDGTTHVTIALGRSGAQAASGELSALAVPSNIALINCTISGADFDTIELSIPIVGGVATSGAVDVPNGTARKFLVTARTQTGEVLYGGSDKADLTGEAVSLTVLMQAVLPLTGTIMTDTGWKSAAASATGWSDTTYNDLGWTAAAATESCLDLTSAWVGTTGGSLIWLPTATDTAEGYFRKSFYLLDKPTIATAVIVAFNDYELYVNGALVGSNADGMADYPAEVYDIAPLLTTEVNTVAIKVTGGEAGCEGLFFALRFDDAAALKPVPVEGRWALTSIGNDSSSPYVDFGTMTFYADGTGAFDGIIKDSSPPRSDIGSFGYTFVDNGDGSYSLTFDPAGAPNTLRVFVADGGAIAFVDNSSRPATEPELIYLVRMDPTRLYGNEDLSGEYYVSGFDMESDGDASAMAGIAVTDGAGSSVLNSTINSNGSIFLMSEPGTYTTSIDGSVNFGEGARGLVGGSGTMGMRSSIYLPTDFDTYFLMKRGDRTYATSDLAGTWVYTTFVGDLGVKTFTTYGVASCDTQGLCRILSTNSPGSPTILGRFSVKSSGAMGESVYPGIPYAMALGNDGNTFAGTLSFDSSFPNHLETILGVRCDACGTVTFP